MEDGQLSPPPFPARNLGKADQTRPVGIWGDLVWRAWVGDGFGKAAMLSIFSCKDRPVCGSQTGTSLQ